MVERRHRGSCARRFLVLVVAKRQLLGCTATRKRIHLLGYWLQQFRPDVIVPSGEERATVRVSDKSHVLKADLLPFLAVATGVVWRRAALPLEGRG